MGLKPKQLKFVKEYLIDQNAARAAKAAGYIAKNKRSAGHTLLTNSDIAKAVKEGIAEQVKTAERRAAERGITKERWLRKLELIAFANIDQYVTVNNDHVNIIATKERDCELGHAIKKLSETQTQYGGSTGIELHSPLHALEIIGKHYGWIKDQIEHSGPGGGPQVIVNLPGNGYEYESQEQNKK